MKRLIVSLLLTLLPLAAQTSSLQGVVTDAQGAVVPAAAITVTNTETNTPRSSLTDESGKYSLLQMPPGSYKMQVQAPGFSVFTSCASPAHFSASYTALFSGTVVQRLKRMR